MATASLILGVVGLFTAGLLVIGSLVGIVIGIVAVTRTSNSPQLYGGRGYAIAGIVLNVVAIVVTPVVFGIIAAIAIPSLLRARVSANEAVAIATVREVATGQAAYAQINAGLYDELSCLAAPAGCVPGHADTGVGFVSPDILTPIANGYERELVRGAEPPSLPPAASPTSMSGFVFLAMADESGDDRGARLLYRRLRHRLHSRWRFPPRCLHGLLPVRVHRAPLSRRLARRVTLDPANLEHT